MLRLTKPYIGKEESKAVNRVLESGWLVEGKQTEQFEQELCKVTGAKYAVATCNCTIALTLALKACSFKYADIAIPDFTHPATAQSVRNAGCTPTLTDVSLKSYNAVFASTDFLQMPVSWAGNPLNSYDDAIIEDAACSLGAGKTGRQIITCFSFHPRKLITTGEGGAVTTNNKVIADNIRSLKNFGKNGGNYRFDDIRAAIGLEQLKKLPTIIKTRREHATVYFELLKDVKGLRLPEYNKDHTYQTFAVYLEKADRDLVIKKLAEKGIETQIGTYALHLLPQFKRLKRSGSLKNSELLYRNLLALPMAYDLTFDDQQKIVEELKTAIA